MELICSTDNLYEAFLRASKGKSSKQAVVNFRLHLEENIQKMGRQMMDGTFQFGQYHFFTIFDPKKRTICAASFPERVAFHAIMRICHPVFDNFQINDSYASRIGKGTYKALQRAREFSGKYMWFAKIDVVKYFDSIHHDTLLRQLCRLFKDPQLLAYFQDLIYGYEVERGRGVPIGNLTSQYFANHYLAVADHYAREQLQQHGYVRYMDDILMFDNDLTRLKNNLKLLSHYIRNDLKLNLHLPVVNNTKFGIPFLGYVVYANRLRLNERSKKRYIHKMASLSYDLAIGNISEKEYANRATCLMAFIDKADCRILKSQLAKIPGMFPKGLQPREPWWQLEQQRQELPCVEPQQQHAVE